MSIQEYIESGILETYVMGAASDEETRKVLYFKDQYPEVNTALKELELDMELLADSMAIMPPPGMWDRINSDINDLVEIPKERPLRLVTGDQEQGNYQSSNERDRYIEVESESSHMRIHKSWKWVFAAVFVLGKIFLGCAIYFYLENRQAQEQLKELKTELPQSKFH